MEDVNSLDFSTFLLNNFSIKETRPSDLSILVQRYYELKMNYSQFLKNPKKRLHIIPDFTEMLKPGYDRAVNPGTEISTYLPLTFTETNETLTINIKDETCNKTVLEITINTDKNIPTMKNISNARKEFFLYDITSVKSKQSNMSTTESGVSTDLSDELTDVWASLKIEIDGFTDKYETFIREHRLLESVLEDYHNNIINNINIDSMRDLENNIIISNITKTGALVDDKTRIIKFYMIMNILITKYSKIQSLLLGNKLVFNMVRSVVFKRGEPINIDNIFIVKSLPSTTKMVVINTMGVETEVSEELYSQVYDHQQLFPNDLGEFNRKHIVPKLTVSVKKISERSLTPSGDVNYFPDSTLRETITYNDLIPNDNFTPNRLIQTIINTPTYKLKESMKSLDGLISYNADYIIYISPKIQHSKLGLGIINAVSSDELVSESGGDVNEFLDKIPYWRNMLVRSYINLNSDGIIEPIILNSKTYSSITHYMLYYANLNDMTVANDYLYEGVKGCIDVSADFSNKTINNSKWSESDNSMGIPNHVYELLRITTAKFIQSGVLKEILLNTGDYVINNAFEDNSLHGVFELSKELLFVRSKLRSDTISEIYPEFEEDLTVLEELKQKTSYKQNPDFASLDVEINLPIDSETILTNSRDVHKIINYDPSFMTHVYKKLQLRDLNHYVESVMHKYIYTVPSSQNALFDSLACSMFDAGVFTSLSPELKSIFNSSVLVTEPGYITLNDRLLQKPILRKPAIELKKLIAEVIKLTYIEFETFAKSLMIKDSVGPLDTINRLLKIKNSIDRRATIKQRPKLNFIYDLLMRIAYSEKYSNINEYIDAIQTENLASTSYEDSWGGVQELTVISALFALDITTHPSYSVDTGLIDGIGFFDHKQSALSCTIPKKYIQTNQEVKSIDLGFLVDNPKHYISIVSTDDIELQLEALLENEESGEEGNLQKLLNMGYSLNFATEALRLNKNNMSRAMGYIFNALQSHVDILESNDKYNFEFQTGYIGINIAGSSTYIQQFHEGSRNSFFKNYHYLEHTHDYIQWLFPNHRPSKYNTDYRGILKLPELELLRETDTAKDNLFLSLRTMMDFFGGELYHDQYGEPVIEPNSNSRERLENINSPPGQHNLLRITRILTYLKLMKSYTLQYLIIDYFLTEIFHLEYGIDWDRHVMDSIVYWINTVGDQRKQNEYGRTFVFLKEEAILNKSRVLHTGGKPRSLTPLAQDYFKFPYKYKNKIYNIVYTNYGGSGAKPKTKILGILDKNYKIDYDRRVKKASFYDNIMSKVYKRLSGNTVNLRGGSIEKIPYTIDSYNDVYIKRNRIGTYVNKQIIFN